MIGLQAKGPDGRKYHAFGHNEEDALKNLARLCERATGRPVTVGEMEGKRGLLFNVPSPERFAELPPGDFTCVCLPSGPDGKLVCSCSCGSNDGSCTCKKPETFSERKPMKRKFDDADTIDAQADDAKAELAELKSQIADALENCVDADALRKALAILSNTRDFADSQEDAKEVEVGKMREALSKFSESDFKGMKRQDVLKSFRAEQRVNPKITAADWLPRL